MTITLAGMVLALVLDVLIAARLGVGLKADALIVALTLPILIDTVVREGTKFTMVTYIIEKKAALDAVEYNRFLSGLLNAFLLLGVLTAAFCWISAPLIVGTIGLGLSQDIVQKSSKLLVIMSPLVIFAFGVNVLNAILASEERFSSIALRSGIAPAAAILMLAAGWMTSDVSLWISIGYLVGYVLYFIIQWRAVKTSGFDHVWKVWPDRKSITEVKNVVVVPTMSFAVNQSARIVERSLASLVTPGGVAIYYFAFRLFSALQTLIGYSFAMTGLPSMKAHELSGNTDKLTTLLMRNLKKVLAISLPIMVVVALFSKQIIHIVYVRGLFTGDTVSLTANVLFWLVLCMPLSNMVPVLNSCLYALGAIRAVFINSVLFAALNVFFSWKLSHLFGLAGIAMGLTLSIPLIVVVILISLRMKGIHTIRALRVASEH